ncbi:hypothetical protein BDV96DRAFT_652444 [Lophiotrema nucula]|uniref:Uncharacterized protein n=1 Tax=Lophiotrema nucula TaxID=690887 RepID=A0A6A5YRP6_9PLEO|nr:hypothetical protein BDV96DRAFT_652444 [Lophiotrema nucula]
MPLRNRRRPVPIQIVPRQEPTPSGAPSPETPGSSPSPTGGPESPDSPSPTKSSFAAPSISNSDKSSVSSTAAAPSITSKVEAPPAAASTTAAPAISSAAASSAPVASSAASSNVNIPIASSQASSIAQTSRAPSTTQAATSFSAAPAVTAPSNPNGSGNSNFSSKNAQPAQSSTSAIDPSPAQSDSAGSVGTSQPQKFKHGHGINGMSIGAEAALITCSVLGALAIIVGLIIFFKRRRRRRQSELRHAEDAFNPSNTGSLSHPETSAVGGYMSHFTASTMTSSLFAGDPDHRPETVSTNNSPPSSRIQPPQPTPNPFADPPLNKAYDVLRGRPRSTTLTDRGSWVQNPFKDPGSERFDPFGELHEKARQERKRYVEEVKREDAIRREQEYLEKERMGLGVPGTMAGISAGQARKGSGVTVEGIGILDRSGEGRYAR